MLYHVIFPQFSLKPILRLFERWKVQSCGTASCGLAMVSWQQGRFIELHEMLKGFCAGTKLVNMKND